MASGPAGLFGKGRSMERGSAEVDLKRRWLSIRLRIKIRWFHVLGVGA